jgi:hypothetical protein
MVPHEIKDFLKFLWVGSIFIFFLWELGTCKSANLVVCTLDSLMGTIIGGIGVALFLFVLVQLFECIDSL